jgi:hyperosmotically inducible periplasmic protein
MKTAFIFFLLGAIAGAFALNYYNEREAGRSSAAHPEPSASLKDKAKDAASQAGDAIAGKLEDWHLTPDDIKRDLARTGEIVRSKAAVAGEKIADARIVTVIKSKYVLDRDLSAIDINVDCKDGDVTLHGRVASPDLIGRATALSLDTDGVHNVVSKLTVVAK